MIKKRIQNKFNLLFFVLIFFSFGSFVYYNYATVNDFSPKKLQIGLPIKYIHIVDAEYNPIEIGSICSVTMLSESKVFLCNYVNLYLLDLSTGIIKMIQKPSYIKKWVPTGLKWSVARQTLYVANYTGKDVLAFGLTPDMEVILKHRYIDSDLKGPENIDVSLDGSMLVIADYDAGNIVLYKEKQKLWSYHIGQAHGVSFSEDENFIIATSLTDAKIYKFDLNGNLLKSTGIIDWHKNGYMWPTSIITYKNNVLISDAHTGKISFLDLNLNPIKSMGGNGLGNLLFNMPYGMEINKNNKLFIADTFKNRLVMVDLIKNEIVSIYQGKIVNYFKHEAFLNNNNDIANELDKDNQQPMGDQYKRRLNKEVVAKIKFSFDKKSIDFDNFVWNGHYGRIISEDLSLNFAKIFPVIEENCDLNTFSYYWVFLKNVLFKDKEATIIWSPQNPIILVIYRGVLCPIKFSLDCWKDDNGFRTSAGFHVTFDEILALADQKVQNYIQDIKDEKKYFYALATHFFGFKDFEQRLEESFSSFKGKAFYKALIIAQNNAEIQKAALNYMDSIKTDKVLSFIEIAIASAILCAL